MQAARKPTVRFRERSELLDFLLEVSAGTSQTLDLDQLLANVAEIVRKVLPYDLFAILLYSERRRDLRIRYAVGHRAEIVANLSVALGEGITGAAAMRREPVLVGDVRSNPHYLNTVDMVRTELAVPMTARGKLVGVIDLQSARINAYTEYDRALLRLIAARVSIAIDNARLFHRADRQNRTLKTLATISREFSSILSLNDLLGKIASTMRALINYDAFSILLVDAEAKALRHRFSIRYDQRVNIDNIPLGKGITGAAAELRDVVRVHDTTKDPRYIASHPDIRSEVAVPLLMPDRLIGVMDLESERVGYFTDDHVRTLALLAPQIASSVENARLYEELASRERHMEDDLKAARELQRVLLPDALPEIEGMEAAVRLRPARQISGDIYDVFEHHDGQTLIAMGDVSGKGAAAALYGSLVSGLLRTLAPRRRQPAELLIALNDALIERRVEARYVTLCVLLWDPTTRRFVMANAGGLPPMICRGNDILKVRVEGVPLGLLDSREYEEVPFQTEPGDVLVLFSDGITDHLNTAGTEYGKGRLTGVVRTHCALPAADLISAIFADMDRFATSAFDDQTLFVMKIQ
ncbi:MAG TPA: SpoIIE family protein phosphatase [Bryobacteraceae bacterium]|jgi:sigma-B regulation protein RsbU (phosphoserine phosphatase)|nr:SpoIIE family protein phosphatase [Bryobacteraceae bacterium]